MNPGFDSFQSMVQQLWPTYKASVQPMWDTRLHRYPIGDLRTVLWQHRADFPDENKPVWKTIYAMLRGGGGDNTASKSDLRILLDQTRRIIAKDTEWMKRKPIDQWSDADVWQNFMDAQTFPTTHQMTAGGWSPREDPDGKVASRAASERTILRRRYESDLTERGDLVPEWLLW